MSQSLSRTIAIALTFALLPPPATAAPRALTPPDIDQRIDQIRTDWALPGVTLAIVHRDGRTLIRGYGLRQWNRDLKVDGDTAFGIASVTKTQVAAAILRLVDQGRIDLDAPVTTYLPHYRVADPWVSAHVTVRDLLSHRTGTSSYDDWLEQLPHEEAEEAVKRFRHAAQDTPFRTHNYNAVGYMVLAAILREMTGTDWAAGVRSLLWEPLGYRSSHVRTHDFVPTDRTLPTADGWLDNLPRGLAAVPGPTNVAAPHAQWPANLLHLARDPRERDLREIHFHRSAIDPNQSAYVSANDMARFLRMLLGNGEIDGRRILSQASVAALQRPAVPSDRLDEPPPAFPQIETHSYGLGFELFRYRGQSCFGHHGGELGSSALMIVCPDLDVALYVATNNRLFLWGEDDAIMQYLLDWHLGAEQQDWSKLNLEARTTEWQHGLDAERALLKANPDRAKTYPKGFGPGLYENPFGGTFRIARTGSRLTASLGPSATWELEPWSGDLLRAIHIGPRRSRMFVRLLREPDGTISALQPQDLDLVFRRKPEPGNPPTP